MCGICGWFGTENPERSTVVERMVQAVAHRGPDGRRVSAVSGAALGHARLAVIDLTGGDQPMADASGRWWIVYNGELYNYRQLRAELPDYPFRTQSDTEVLLAAWLRWGPDSLNRFRGMFAFAIWDTERRALFAARDLFGEKPFYYAFDDDGGLLAASEIKGVLASKRVRPKLDPAAIDAYLALGYVPPDRTVWQNVHALPPGHRLTFNTTGLRVECYWRSHLASESMDADTAAERLRELVHQAVRRQLVADVPVGAFLSGGLDSSTIVAVMSEQDAAPRTFSVGFGDAINELPYARAVADRYATDHHEIDLGEPDVADLLERMATVYDEPFADTSHVPTYLMAGFARRHVKVVLTGDGADELFGGYDHYLPLVRSENVRGSYWRWLIGRAVVRLGRLQGTRLDHRSRAQGLAARWPDMWTRSVMAQTHLPPRLRQRFWRDRYRVPGPEAMLERYRAEMDDGDEGGDGMCGRGGAFHFDLTCYLPGDILVKVDRAAMAHGLETRVPFLDRDVVEFMLAVPTVLKVDDGRTKILLRRAFESAWPPEIRRRGKQGFGSPMERWRQRADVRTLAADVFASRSRLRRLLPGLKDPDRCGNPYGWWILLTLGLWLETNNIPI